MEKNKIIKRGADLRVLEFLKDLQNNIYDSNIIYLNQMARKHKIGMCYGTSLIDLKIIKRVSPQKYLWLGNNPSLIMAKKILKHYSTKYKNVIENEQIEIKFKEPVKRKYTKRQDIKQTEEKSKDNKPSKPRTTTNTTSYEFRGFSHIPKTENNIYSLNILWGLIKIQKS